MSIYIFFIYVYQVCKYYVCFYLYFKKINFCYIFKNKFVINNNKLEIINYNCNIFISMFNFKIRYLIYIINYLY